MGVVAGTGLTDDYGSRFTSYLFPSAPFPEVIGNFQSSGSRGLIAGPMLEFSLPKNMFLEVDGLYRELNFFGSDLLSDGTRNNAARYPTITWEIPALAKYKFSVPASKSLIQPFLEAGPSFRLTGNLNTNPSHYGFTGGVGVEFHWRLNVAPVVRYTRWAQDAGFSLRSKTDQIEFLVGFSDSAGSNLHPLGKHFSLGGVAGASLTDPFANVTSPAYVNYPPSGAPDGAFSTKGLTSFVVGPMVELELPKNLSLEVDALRRPLRTSTELKLNDGTAFSFAFSNPTWEFPLLAKYRFATPTLRLLAKPGLRPFVELGPTFRLVEGQAGGTSIGAHGITAGVGLEVKLRALKIAPSIRYTRWGGQNYPPGFLITLSPNQAALLIGFSF